MVATNTCRNATLRMAGSQMANRMRCLRMIRLKNYRSSVFNMRNFIMAYLIEYNNLGKLYLIYLNHITQ